MSVMISAVHTARRQNGPGQGLGLPFSLILTLPQAQCSASRAGLVACVNCAVEGQGNMAGLWCEYRLHKRNEELLAI